jgi:hypothetical protein
MSWLCEIMESTSGWKGVWWGTPETERVLWSASKLGLIRRPSTTQVEWTEKGAALARKYIWRKA